MWDFCQQPHPHPQRRAILNSNAIIVTPQTQKGPKHEKIQPKGTDRFFFIDNSIQIIPIQ